MSKRVQMIPLFILIICGSISLSSGLYYYEVNEAVYVIHVFVMGALYYVIRYLFREMEQRELISLGVSMVILGVFFILLYPITKPGICDMLNTISSKLRLSYGIDLGKWREPDSDVVWLVICQLTAFVTVLSFYFYEKKYPVVIAALPSFLLFIVSIIADGVPYEVCFIVYGAALIIFLGMGRHGGNIKKMVLLTSCTVIAGLLFVMVFSWNDVDLFMRGYRDRFMISNHSSVAKREKDKTPEKKKQTINFGQFSMSGDITYTGTVELYLHRDQGFHYETLFLRGFIGNSFEDNMWQGDFMRHEFDSHENAVVMREGIRVENAFDPGIYVPYALSDEYYDRLMEAKCKWKKINLEKVEPETRYVDEDLKDEIENYILGMDEFDTIGDAVEFVKDYFSVGYKYTLHPGEVLYGEDEVEKFLFERRTGYCTHFASAAIMILRTAGVPARLAQGYMVSGNRISQNEITSVYDSNAHAWVEIYVDEEGWIPIDVTPRMNRVAEGENATDGDAEAVDMVPEEEPVEDGVTEDQAEDGITEDQAVEPDEEEEEPEEEDELVDEEEETAEGDENVPAGRDKTGKSGIFSREENAGRNDVSTVLKYVAGFLVIDLILLIALVGYRLRQYAMMKRRLVEGDFSERLLHMNDNLKKFWRILGIEWDYTDSEKLTESIYRAILKYYIFGASDSASEFRQRIHLYVLSVYKARYDGTSISQAEYDSCQAWVLELFEQMRRHNGGKTWKRVKKYDMVKIIYKKEKRKCNG